MKTVYAFRNASGIKPVIKTKSLSSPPGAAQHYINVIDTSGSMQGARLNSVIGGIKKNLDELSPNDTVDLMTFSSDVYSFDGTEMKCVGKSPEIDDQKTLFDIKVECKTPPLEYQKEKLINILDKIRADGSTSLLPAIVIAITACPSGSILNILTDGAGCSVFGNLWSASKAEQAKKDCEIVMGWAQIHDVVVNIIKIDNDRCNLKLLRIITRGTNGIMYTAKTPTPDKINEALKKSKPVIGIYAEKLVTSSSGVVVTHIGNLLADRTFFDELCMGDDEKEVDVSVRYGFTALDGLSHIDEEMLHVVMTDDATLIDWDAFTTFHLGKLSDMFLEGKKDVEEYKNRIYGFLKLHNESFANKLLEAYEVMVSPPDSKPLNNFSSSFAFGGSMYVAKSIGGSSWESKGIGSFPWESEFVAKGIGASLPCVKKSPEKKVIQSEDDRIELLESYSSGF